MGTFAQKQNQPKKPAYSGLARPDMVTRAAPAMQTKLVINKPGDEYEREADRASEQVMRIREPQLQCACSSGEGCSTCQRGQLDRKHERQQPMSVAMSRLVEPRFGHGFSRVRVDADPRAAQSAGAVAARPYTVGADVGSLAPAFSQRGFWRLAAGSQPEGEAPPIVHDVLRSPGQPLELAARTFMESRFGHDFSKVRVRTGAHAADSARAVQARAYTVGQDIVFGAGQYAPGTREGRLLLAHELVHVIQQHAGAVSMPTVQRDDKKGKDDKKSDVKSEEKPAAWTRKLAEGPRLLDGKKASYQVWFDHILPPVPKGATQMWQVVENKTTSLTDKCEEKTETDYVVDIVTVDKRTKIRDDWGWIPGDEPCFVVRVSQATVGFDDKKSNFAQQTSVKVSQEDAKDVLTKMTGPKGTYSGTYTFVKSENCRDCSEKLKKLQEKQKAPNGEALAIEGVGSWTS